MGMSAYQTKYRLTIALNSTATLGPVIAGHGTAVASIAASTGLASGKFVGVAPGAYIISVKLADGYEDHVLDGFNYLVTKARKLGMPLVIDYSFGDISWIT